MANETYLKASIELGEDIKPHIYTFDKNGKKYLPFEIHPLKAGADQYGNTHTISIRYKASDGNYYTKYIGKAKTATFGEGNGQQTPPPPPAPAAPAPAKPAPAPAPVAPPPAPAPEEEPLPF